MKSLVIALSLLLAYTPAVNAQENTETDFGVESDADFFVNDVSEMATDAARSSQEDVGKIVILEGAGNLAVAKYLPNPEEDAAVDNIPAPTEGSPENIIPETKDTQDNDEAEISEIIPDSSDETKVDQEAENQVPAEDTETDSIQDDVAEVVIIEGSETTGVPEERKDPEESSDTEENVTVDEVVIETQADDTPDGDEKSENAVQAEGEEVEVVDIAEVPVVVEEDSEDDGKTKEDYDEEISYYIKNMNLSVEQLDMAKYISSDSRLKMDQLLKSIYLLRTQARELEEKSLDDFESILTEEQKEQFHKLRATQEKSRKKFEVFDVRTIEESQVENQPKDADEDGEDEQTGEKK